MYLGPVDGHDIGALVRVLREAMQVQGPVLVHVMTKKGYGYPPAERHPARFHGTAPFEIKSGLPVKNEKPTYTDIFSTVMRKMGDREEKVVAVTAAMETGTGLKRFHNMFPDRFFDVGIAEEHAVTFAAALAAGEGGRWWLCTPRFPAAGLRSGASRCLYSEAARWSLPLTGQGSWEVTGRPIRVCLISPT